MGRYVTFDGMSGAGKGTFVAWCVKQLESSGRKVAVLADRDIDPLRGAMAKMLPWIEKHGRHKQSFLFSAYVAGGALAERAIANALHDHDFVLRDRSFITSLATQTCEGVFTQEEVWDLYSVYMDFMTPDLAVIVDADVSVAMEREAKRPFQDKGLGGRMSGNAERRVNMRQQFLEIPKRFVGRMDTVVVTNNGAFTEDAEEIQRRVNAVGMDILQALSVRRLI